MGYEVDCAREGEKKSTLQENVLEMRRRNEELTQKAVMAEEEVEARTAAVEAIAYQEAELMQAIQILCVRAEDAEQERAEQIARLGHCVALAEADCEDSNSETAELKAQEAELIARQAVLEAKLSELAVQDDVLQGSIEEHQPLADDPCIAALQ